MKYETLLPGDFHRGILYPEETLAQMRKVGISLSDFDVVLRFITRPIQSLQDAVRNAIIEKNQPLHLWLFHDDKRYFLEVFRVKSLRGKKFKAGNLMEV